MFLGEIFKKKLLICREKNEMSYAKAGQKVGISDRAYSYYEQGKRTPSIDIAKNIADCFGVSLDYLVGNSVSAYIVPYESEMSRTIEVRIQEKKIFVQKGTGKILNPNDVVNAESYQAVCLARKLAVLNEPEPETYAVIGYDKDSDCYVEFSEWNTLKEAIEDAEEKAMLCRKDELLNPDNQEPIDWIEVTDKDNYSSIYWTSYN